MYKMANFVIYILQLKNKKSKYWEKEWNVNEAEILEELLFQEGGL